MTENPEADAQRVRRTVPGTSGRDASPGERLRTVRQALVGSDLVAPGPGLLPFGRRARALRRRRREVATVAEQRRRELREQVLAEWVSRDPVARRRRRVRGRVPRGGVLALAGVTAAVFTVVALMPSTVADPVQDGPSQLTQISASPAGPRVTASSVASASSTASSVPVQDKAVPPVPPVPPSGVSALSPPPALPPVDPGSVRLVEPPPPTVDSAELSTPESAAVAWLSRWCPFDYRQPLGAAEDRSRDAMTAQEWSRFDPRGNPAVQRSWQLTVAARETARCSQPQALVSPAAPRTADSAIVFLDAWRVVTAENGTSYTESVQESRILRREPDRLWRVDAATVGG